MLCDLKNSSTNLSSTGLDWTNLGHWSYLFKMWTQEPLRDLTTKKVIEECLALFQIKQHYERQNVDPPAELLADLELLNEEIKTQFGLIKIILNCITLFPQ